MGKNVNGSVTERVAANQQMMLAEHYAGPIPHPQILAQYENVVPGLAKAIADDYMANAGTARQIGMKALEYQFDKDKRGQWMALGIEHGLRTGGDLVVSLHFRQ